MLACPVIFDELGSGGPKARTAFLPSRIQMSKWLPYHALGAEIGQGGGFYMLKA